MAFTPTFGSFGDFITVSILVKDILRAFDGVRGSTAEYLSLIKELHTLDLSLSQFDQICISHLSGAETYALKQSAMMTLDDCKADVECFKQQIHDYQAALGSESANVFERAAKKVRWLTKKHDIDQFRAKVVAHQIKLNLLLSMASLTILHREQDEMQADPGRCRIAITDILERARKMGEKLLSLVRFMVFQNMQIYREVIAIRTIQYSRLERPILEEFFTFEDATGRIVTIPLRTVDSWSAFYGLLTIRFKDRKGAGRVARNQYTLQEHGSHKFIDQNLPRNIAILFGQRVDMSVICRLLDPDNVNSVSSCPNCGAVSQLPLDEDVQCFECNLHYRRITELEGDEEGQTKPRAKSQDFGQGGKREYPSLNQPMKKALCQCCDTAVEVEDSDEDDVSGFTRVKLTTRRNQTDHIKTKQLLCHWKKDYVMDPLVKQNFRSTDDDDDDNGSGDDNVSIMSTNGSLATSIWSTDDNDWLTDWLTDDHKPHSKIIG